MEKIRVIYPVIVEGKYDKIRLENVIDTEIIVLNGFGIFKEKEKSAMLRRISERSPVIVLTDSDGGGLVIRNYLRSIIPSERLINLYTPEIHGKEKRKTEASKEGFLGVEGMENELLRELFAPFSSDEPKKKGAEVTRAELYSDGLLGGAGSKELRKKLCLSCGLPQNISTSALVEVLSLLYSYDEYKALIDSLKAQKEK